jgi:hypothetical protein
MRSDSSDFTARLTRLRQQIDTWRATRVAHAPMPAALWDAATALARERGVNPVRQALGLSYRSLQLRVAAPPTSEVPAPLHFVDVTPLVGASSEVVVDLTDAHGTRLSVRLPAGTSFDLAGVITAFRRGAP